MTMIFESKNESTKKKNKKNLQKKKHSLAITNAVTCISKSLENNWISSKRRCAKENVHAVRMLSKVWLSLYAWFLNVSTPTVEAVTDFGPESVVSSDIFLTLRYFLHQNSFIAFIADKRRIFTWTTTLVGCPIDVEQMLRLFTSLRALITLTMTEKNLRRQKKNTKWETSFLSRRCLALLQYVKVFTAAKQEGKRK